MRLGQLARKISIRQSDMVDFLAKTGVVVINESNVRLEDEHVKNILQHFAPNFLNEKIEEVETVVPEAIVVEPIFPSPVQEKVVPQEEVVLKIGIPSIEVEQEEKTEVIKAPKVDLPGLKVLGKIELPEPKKKEIAPLEEADKVEEQVTNSDVSSKPQIQRSRVLQDNKRERPNRSAVNSIALQREHDARAAEEKRKTDAIQEKEKRTEYYLKRVKVNAPTKAARIYAEPVDQYTSSLMKEEPKTLLGKFLRWLTT